MKIAAITTVHNEYFFLPHFIRHYEREVDHIFILDNDTSDGSIDPFRHDPFVSVSSYSTPYLLDQVKIDRMLEVKRACLGKFDYVMVLDTDEFVVAKQGKTIREVLATNPDRDVFGTDGRNIYTYPEDAPLDPERLLIDQRRHGVPNAHYSKPILMKTTFEPDFVLGCHYLKNYEPPQVCRPEDALFFIMHYRGVDEEHYLRRALETSRRMDPTFLTNWYHGGDRESYRKKLEYERYAGKVEKII